MNRCRRPWGVHLFHAMRITSPFTCRQLNICILFFRFTLAVHVCIQLRHSSLIFFRSINNPVCPYENTVCPNSGSTFHRNSPLPLVIMPLNRRGCFPTPMRASLFPPHIQFFYGVFFFRCLWIFLCFSFYIFIFLSFCFVPS